MEVGSWRFYLLTYLIVIVLLLGTQPLAVNAGAALRLAGLRRFRLIAKFRVVGTEALVASCGKQKVVF